VRPSCSLLSRANVLQFSQELIAQCDRCLGPKHGLGGISVCAATSCDLLGGITLTTVHPTALIRRRFLSSQGRGRRCLEIGSVDIVLAGNANKQGVTAGVGQRRAHPVRGSWSR